MMCAAKRRASGSSVGKNSTVRASPSRLASMAPNHPCGSFSRSQDLPFFRLSTPKLAVQGRYNQSQCLCVSSCSLQGIAERPLPCNYNVIQFAFTAVTRVQIPSGTPNAIKSLRGKATFAGGTKRHNFIANFLAGFAQSRVFSGIRSCFCRHKKAHATPPDQAAATAGARNRRTTLL